LDQAQAYRVLLKNIADPAAAINLQSMDKVGVSKQREYFNVLVCNELWKKLEFEKVFPSSKSRQLISCEQVARILTINKLLDPRSKVKTIEWFEKTLLAEIMGIDAKAYNRSKIFRELSNIHVRKPAVEKMFNEFSKKRRSSSSNDLSVDVFYFDGTTSWFEGEKCSLAKYDLEKTRGLYPEVIALMMVTDNAGYPVAWEAVDGNRKDTSELKALFQRLHDTYGIQQITYCFDRGVASEANFELIDKSKDSKFISGIRDNQIAEYFEDLTFFAKVIRPKLIEARDKARAAKTKKRVLRKSSRYIVGTDNFYTSVSGNTHFKDLGVRGDYRYIVAFNVDYYEKEQTSRLERIKKALYAVDEFNEELSSAQRERDYSTVERQLITILSKHRVREFFDHTLYPAVVDKRVSSFKIELTPNSKAVEEASLTDGMMVYVTDHTEKKEGTDAFHVSARDIVDHYRNKFIIEDFFKKMKSFVELRPFYVWKEAHVKAHYDIAVMACFINNYINEALKKLGEDDSLSLSEFYEHLDESSRVVTLTTPNGYSQMKAMDMPKPLKDVLMALGIADVGDPALHIGHGVYH
jgi:transposase